MALMCHFSPPGSNTAMILFGSGPGAMILLSKQPTTDRLFANGTIPIPMSHCPATVIQSNFDLPRKSIVTDGTNMN
eukprot:1378885-Ditylum_brightwellii.AAC.1